MIPERVRIVVCCEGVDMRYGFDRLAGIAKTRLGEDPLRGEALCVFANKAANRLKILWFDRNGYVFLYKRLHRAVFELPVAGRAGEVAVRIDGARLAKLLAGVERKRRSRA